MLLLRMKYVLSDADALSRVLHNNINVFCSIAGSAAGPPSCLVNLKQQMLLLEVASILLWVLVTFSETMTRFNAYTMRTTFVAPALRIPL